MFDISTWLDQQGTIFTIIWCLTPSIILYSYLAYLRAKNKISEEEIGILVCFCWLIIPLIAFIMITPIICISAVLIVSIPHVVYLIFREKK